MKSVRSPAVAGSFYPRDPARLECDVDALLAAARDESPLPSRGSPKALIVPHAGYVYSGAVAARAYRLLEPVADRIRRVVLLGPAHRVAVRGLALPGAEIFATPLGEIPVDAGFVARLGGFPQVRTHAGCHLAEHSLEVQLPFLQRVLGDFSLLPLVVGDASVAEVAEVLRALWGGPETLIVVSSDLSHYLPYAVATRVDRATVERVLAGDARLGPDEACGAAPVNGLLAAAAAMGLTAELLDLRNSGDTAGDRERVVGYASLVFRAPDPAQATGEDGPAAHVAHARGAIAEALGLPAPPAAALPSPETPGAVFVTLMLDGALRGCIGSLEAHRPLREDLRANALAAAFRDPRFPPLSIAEFARVRVEVSELSPPETLAVASEAEAWAAVAPGIHGVVLEWRRHRSTFLPQVWAQLPTAREFFAALKRKAGLPADFWAPDLRVARYTVRKWVEA